MLVEITKGQLYDINNTLFTQRKYEQQQEDGVRKEKPIK